MAFLRPATPRGLHLLPHVVHPRRTPTLLAMAAAVGIANFPTSAIAVALPAIHEDLNASVGELQWTVTAFTLAMSAFLIAAGRLADIYGRRRIVLAGAGLFAGGSAIAALAPTAIVLIAGLAVAGLGAAALVPASLSIIVNAYPPEKRGLPIGVWGASSALAQAVGPLVGGALTGGLSWNWVFWLGTIVAVGIAFTVMWATAESSDPEAERRIDSLGLALVAGALVTLSLAIIQAPTWGWTEPQTIVLFAASIVLAAAFVVVERRVEAPLVNFAFFRARNFSGATIVLFVLNFALIVALFFLPLYLQELLGYSATEAGALMLPLMAAMVVMLPLGGKIVERTGPLPPIIVGIGTLTLSMFLLAGIDTKTTYSDVWLPMALCGGGTGLALTPMNVAAMNAIPTRQSGAAGGVFTTLSGIGISFGVAISGAVFNSVQVDETQSLAAAQGVKVSEAQATGLDGLLAGASDAQSGLSQFAKSSQAVLENVVDDAFVHAFGSAMRVGAFVALAGLVLALALIRNRPPADEVEAAPSLSAAGSRAG